MSIPTDIDFRDYLKAVDILAIRRGYILKRTNKPGSGIRFELFKNENDPAPIKMWVVHEDLREKKIYSKDLKKSCEQLGVTRKDFENLIRNKFK